MNIDKENLRLAMLLAAVTKEHAGPLFSMTEHFLKAEAKGDTDAKLLARGLMALTGAYLNKRNANELQELIDHIQEFCKVKNEEFLKSQSLDNLTESKPPETVQ